MSLYWPTSLPTPHLPFQTDIMDPIIRTPFESGHVQTRRRFTTSKRRFKLNWTYMGEADLTTLRNFVNDDVHGGADSFFWDNPDPNDSTTYEVRILGDSFSFELIADGYYAVSLELEEV